MSSFIPNPHYGSGVFRRRTRLVGQPGLVVAEMEDSFHAFRIRVSHDGERVTDIAADAVRHPQSLCLGAVDELRRFIGEPLSGDRRVLRERQTPSQHCTHQYDLVWLAMAQALRCEARHGHAQRGDVQRGDAQRVYDVEVPDSRDGRIDAMLRRDGQLVLHWRLEGSVITAPQAIAGRSPFAEFGRWASAAYAGDELEAAYVLQVCCMVSGARRMDVEAMADTVAIPNKIKPGSCYAFQPERIGKGIRTRGMVRDFSDAPEQLLKFT
jgi:hypothetical protein